MCVIQYSITIIQCNVSYYCDIIINTICNDILLQYCQWLLVIYKWLMIILLLCNVCNAMCVI